MCFNNCVTHEHHYALPCCSGLFFLSGFMMPFLSTRPLKKKDNLDHAAEARFTHYQGAVFVCEVNPSLIKHLDIIEASASTLLQKSSKEISVLSILQTPETFKSKINWNWRATRFEIPCLNVPGKPLSCVKFNFRLQTCVRLINLEASNFCFFFHTWAVNVYKVLFSFNDILKQMCECNLVHLLSVTPKSQCDWQTDWVIDWLNDWSMDWSINWSPQCQGLNIA